MTQPEQKKTQQRPRWLKATHPGFMFVAIVAIAALMELVLPFPLGTGPRSGWITFGAILFVSAGASAAWAAVTLRRAGTPIEPGSAAVKLVDSGPFAVSRNPMYLALSVGSFGFALCIGSRWLAAGAALLWLLLAVVVIPQEERQLLELFGRTYERYCSTVRRWF